MHLCVKTHISCVMIQLMFICLCVAIWFCQLPLSQCFISISSVRAISLVWWNHAWFNSTFSSFLLIFCLKDDIWIFSWFSILFLRFGSDVLSLFFISSLSFSHGSFCSYRVLFCLAFCSPLGSCCWIWYIFFFCLLYVHFASFLFYLSSRLGSARCFVFSSFLLNSMILQSCIDKEAHIYTSKVFPQQNWLTAAQISSDFNLDLIYLFYL